MREGLIDTIESSFLELGDVEVTNDNAQTIRAGGPVRGSKSPSLPKGPDTRAGFQLNVGNQYRPVS